MADDPFPAWPQVEAPLEAFAGEEPPAPAWFNWAIAQEPERSMVPIDGANIELLTWGEVGKPGLILVHGNSAHADWWSFIAPYLAADYRVAAISFSGMGGSDWREAYSFRTFAAEAHGAALAAGLYEAPVQPVFIGHSFGGAQVFHAAMNYPEWMRGAILVDTGFGGPPPAAEGAAEGFRSPWGRTQPNRIYPSLAAALARFRFMPPQGCSNPYIADFIARRSLKRVPLPEGEGEGGGEGWTWRFDPQLWTKLDRTAMESIAPSAAQTPLIHIYGQNSKIIERHAQQQQSFLPPGTPQIIIPDSEHHIMVDQPLALVAALRSVLACWP
jgi:pimeloyl-ACP methyl ester carboxylesterase